MKLKSVARTDIGLRRSKNEDAYGYDDDHYIYIVADGMGGHVGGEFASKIAVDTILQFLVSISEGSDVTWPGVPFENITLPENALKAAIQLAHQEILNETRRNPSLKTMATTIVATLFLPEDRKALIGHVGDSRAYLIRRGKIIQLTQDHSWVTEQVMAGILTPDQAKNHRLKNVVTRALGAPQEPVVDINEEPLQKDDIFLFCTDGLTTHLEDGDILGIVLEYFDDLETAADQLIEATLERGAEDNVTFIIVRVVEP